MGSWQQVEVLGSGLHGVDGELGAVVEEYDDDLEEPTVDVIIADPVFAGRAVDLHLGIVLRN